MAESAPVSDRRTDGALRLSSHLCVRAAGCLPVTVNERPPSRVRRESDPDGAGFVCSLLWNIEKVETRTKARHVSMEKGCQIASRQQITQTVKISFIIYQNHRVQIKRDDITGLYKVSYVGCV